ncbi:MAG: carbon-monoxide dehydrogenase large subunit [Paracoccaceae bacterium]|jgi:carbon-monoxide dehydrogenase large subunit
MIKFGIGQALTRKEDDRFLRGAGRYADDIVFPGQTFAAVVRSDAAHATFAPLDLSAARAAPGVLLAWAHEDIAGRLAPLTSNAPIAQADGSPLAPVFMPHLADGTVRFVGQPIAFVVARSHAEALDAAELIVAEFSELAAVTQSDAALADGAPQLHDGAPGNRSYLWSVGDQAATDAAFDAAAKVVSVPVRNQRVIVNAMEPRATNAKYEGDRWLVWSGTQGSHSLRGKLAVQMGVDEASIRVHTPDVGGAFGMKLQAHPEDALVCLAAKDLGVPVKWTATRSESFLSDAQARDLRTVAEGAFDADGKIIAIRAKSISNLGAYYSTFGAGIHTAFSASLLGGMYDVPNMYHEVVGAFTNTTPTDAYRGAGRPEVISVTEHVIDAGARAFDADPTEFRRRNLIRRDQIPYASQGGMVFDSLDAGRNIDDAMAASDEAGFAARREAAAARGAALGRAAVYYYERTGGGPIERATINILPSGIVEAAVGTQTTGQGHETAWSQLIHQKLGVPYDSVKLLQGDTDLLPAGGGTGGSRSLIMASRVFLKAGDQIIEKAMESASALLEAAPADIEFDAEAGARFRIKGTDRTVTLFDVATEMGGILGEGGVDDRESTYPNGCHVAETEVDLETGQVSLTRYDIVDDFGVVINPLLVAGQVHGGVAQGVGQVLHEGAAWDPDTAQPLAASYMDYQMPRASDMPHFSFKLNEVPSTTNPLGVKGCGEAGTVAAIPAAALAVADALRSVGAEAPEPPFAPWRVWQALQARR